MDSIESALTAAAQSFKVALAQALDVLGTVSVEQVDASAVTTGIEAAVEAAEVAPVIEADASGVTEAIDDAVADADSEVTVDGVADAVTAAVEDAIASADTTATVEGDASPVAEAILAAAAGVDPSVTVEGNADAVLTAIEAAVAGADRTVDLDAVTQAITEGIEQAIAGADRTVDLEVDTSGAESSLSGLASAGEQATESVGGSADALGALQGASSLAQGDLSGVEGALGAVGARAGLVVGGATAVAAAIGTIAASALESDTVTRRFERTLGEFAGRVEGIGVEGLADDLESLAERTGNSDEAMRLAAARVFDLGRSSGVAAPEVAKTTEQILLLATRASVLNPTLGDAGAIAERLSNSLARGGRFVTDFGLALTPAQIQAEALARNVGKTSEELTIYDRAAAGAALASEQLGTRLREDIAGAADQPVIALRRLREEFGNALEAFGAPLLQPLLDAAEEGQPILLEFGETFGELGATLVPVLVDALKAAAPVITTVADVVQVLLGVLRPVLSVIDAIPDPVLAGVAAFALFRSVLGPVGTALSALVGRLALAAGPAGFAGLVNPIGLAAAALGTAIGVITAYTAAKEEQRRKINEVAEAFLDEAKAIDEDVEASVRSRVASKNQEDDLRRIGLSVQEFADLSSRGREGFLEFVAAMERGGEVTPAVAEALRQAGGTAGDFGSALQEAGGTTREAIDSNLGLVDSFTALADESQKAAEAALTKLVNDEKLTEEALRQAEANNRNADGTVNYVAALQAVAPASDEAARAQGEAAEAAGDLGRASGDAAQVSAELSAALKEQAEEADELNAALNDLLDATMALLNTQISTEEANIRFGDSLADVASKAAALAEAERDHGRASTEATAARREYEDAIRDSRDAALSAAEAELRLADDTAEASGRVLDAQERQDIFRASLERVAREASGPTAAAIRGLIQTYDTIPATKRTELTADATQAKRELDDIKKRLGQLSAEMSVSIVASNRVRAAQHGGTFVGPQVVQVGEAGRELVFVQPGVTATVLPNPATERMLASNVTLDPSVQAALERAATTPRVSASFAIAGVDEGRSAYRVAYEAMQMLDGIAIQAALG